MIQSSDSEDDQDVGNRMEEKIENMHEIFNKYVEELKKQTNKLIMWQLNWKNPLAGINSRLTGRTVGDFEDRMMEITATEEKKKKKKRDEKKLYQSEVLFGNTKCTNINFLGIPEGEERKGLRKYLKR